VNKNKINSEILAQTLILVVAACALFWQYPHLQFTHDELSALQRTQFESFGELIDKGIRIDGHPAGVQTFLYYYAPLVNYSSWALKLPFSLLALGSIVLVFAIAKAIKQQAAGIYTGAIMAVSQYFIYYGQITRPYEAGLFFSLLSAWFWMCYFYQNAHFKNLIGFAIAAAGAAYSHQFSLLLVGIMGVHALIIADAKARKHWLLCALLAFALYLPHLGIFLHQLSLGGVGTWLAKPGLGFLGDYLFYLLHFSLLFAAAVLFSIISPPWRIKKSTHWEGLIWFAATFLVGFIYSHWVDSVLQYSTLIFVAPLLLLSLFALRQMRLNWISLILILSTGLYSLYADRLHYPLSYKSPFKYPREYLKTHHLANAELILDLDEEKWAFYAKLDQYDNSNSYHYSKPSDLKKHLRAKRATTIIFAADHGSPLFIPRLFETCGYAPISKENHFGFSLYHFSKDSLGAIASLKKAVNSEAKSYENKDKYCAKLSLTISKEELLGKQDFVLAEYQLKETAEESHSLLIIAFFAKGKLLHWSSQKISKFQSETSFSVFHAKSFLHHFDDHPIIEVQAMLESKGELLEVEHSSLKLMPGNNRIYGINQAFH
jgi:hypothetical protein